MRPTPEAQDDPTPTPEEDGAQTPSFGTESEDEAPAPNSEE